MFTANRGVESALNRSYNWQIHPLNDSSDYSKKKFKLLDYLLFCGSSS